LFFRIIVTCGEALFYKSQNRRRGRGIETGRTDSMALGKKQRDARPSGEQQSTLERFQGIIDRPCAQSSARCHHMAAGRVSLGRDFAACQEWMSRAGDADESVAKEHLRARFRRRFSENADVQIDQPFSKGTRILVGLWRKAQADARSGFGDRGHQWGGTKFDEPFVGANCEGQLQSADIQVIRGRPQNGLRVAGQRMNAIA